MNILDRKCSVISKYFIALKIALKLMLSHEEGISKIIYLAACYLPDIYVEFIIYKKNYYKKNIVKLKACINDYIDLFKGPRIYLFKNP